MMNPEEQAELWRSVDQVRQTVLTHLQANRSPTFAITFVANLQRGVDHIVQTARDQGLQFDCQAGCSHCCNVRVEALPPEVFQISNALKQLPSQEVEAWIARLRQHSAMVENVSVWDHHIRCPFLQDSLCSIYPVRPATCRKVHSFDVLQCKTPGSSLPQSFEVALKSEALIKGTAEAYVQCQWPASAHELGQAVLLALTDETAESRWYAGESVF